MWGHPAHPHDMRSSLHKCIYKSAAVQSWYEVMQNVSFRYTRWNNKRQSRIGHHLVRYIHPGRQLGLGKYFTPSMPEKSSSCVQTTASKARVVVKIMLSAIGSL